MISAVYHDKESSVTLVWSALRVMDISLLGARKGGGFARKRNLDSALCQHRNTQKEAEVSRCLHCSPDLGLIGLHLRDNSCPTFRPRARFYD